jgi:hypothetical protein
MSDRLPVKIVVIFERREDGGLRVFSDDVPGFVLSHSDPRAVLDDVKPALERMLLHILGKDVVVSELSRLNQKIVEPIPPEREYAAFAA